MSRTIGTRVLHRFTSWAFPTLAMRVTLTHSGRQTRRITARYPILWPAANNWIATSGPQSCATATGITLLNQWCGTRPFPITPSQVPYVTQLNRAGGQWACRGQWSDRIWIRWLDRFLHKSDFYNSAVGPVNHLQERLISAELLDSADGHTSRSFIAAIEALLHSDD